MHNTAAARFVPKRTRRHRQAANRCHKGHNPASSRHGETPRREGSPLPNDYCTSSSTSSLILGRRPYSSQSALSLRGRLKSNFRSASTSSCLFQAQCSSLLSMSCRRVASTPPRISQRTLLRVYPSTTSLAPSTRSSFPTSAASPSSLTFLLKTVLQDIGSSTVLAYLSVPSPRPRKMSNAFQTRSQSMRQSSEQIFLTAISVSIFIFQGIAQRCNGQRSPDRCPQTHRPRPAPVSPEPGSPSLWPWRIAVL